MFKFKKEKKKEEGAEIAKDKTKIRLVSMLFIRYFELIVTVFIILIFVSSFFFLIKPKYNDLVEASQFSKEDKEAEKIILKNYLEKLEEYIEAYNSVSDNTKDRIGKILPPEDVQEDFFIKIENLISRQGLVLESVDISKIDLTATNSYADTEGDQATNQLPKDIGEVKLNLEVSGVDYKALKRLLLAFETNLRVMDVTGFDFSPDKKSVTLSVATYFQK